MKTIIMAGWSLVLVMLFVRNTQARYVSHEYPEVVNTNKVTVIFKPDHEAPEWMAAIVQPDSEMDVWRTKGRETTLEDGMDDKRVQWLPFKTRMTVDLGPGDGRREILFSFKYKGQTHSDGWSGGGIVIRTNSPQIVITSPAEQVTSHPEIQLCGYFSAQAKKLKFDLYDQNGVKIVNEANALVTDSYFDKKLWLTTTDYFQCFDVSLSPGTNTFVIQGEDALGNRAVTNFVIVFTTVGDIKPPVIKPRFPLNGASIQSDNFIVTGYLDDPSAHMAGTISADGQTQNIDFRIGRSGDYFSVQELPVRAGTNFLTLTATDAAGNISKTNMVFYDGGGIHIAMDPFDPFHPAGPWITVTGKVKPVNCDVWVNGVQAKVKSDGTWRAEKLPDNRVAGGWIFDMAAIRLDQSANGSSQLNQSLSAQASLCPGTNAIFLNASVPACGGFQLHLMGISGRRFVLEASTNLTEWLPILTNFSADPTFDYIDTSAQSFPCRFFRVVPLPQ